MVILFAIFAIVIMLLVSGAYVFVVACFRRKELPWLVKEELEKTPFGRFYECIVAADQWLKDHDAQSVWITSDDGLKLHGLWVPAENPKGTVLLVHGYRSSKLMDFGVAFPYYHEKGFNLLIPDQRAHGKSQGRYITFGVKESADMLRWIDFHNDNYGIQPILLSGMSMGASTVMFLADAELPRNVKGLITDCGYTSANEIICSVFRRVIHFPAGPVMWSADLFARIFAGFSFYGKNTVKTLKKNQLPILIVHGTQDTFVPCDMSKRSYAACSGPKELLLIEGADHGVSFLVDHRRYTAAVESLISVSISEYQ